MIKRTHNCNALRKGDIGKEVRLNGWVQNRRDHGGLIFIDVRDRFGLTQIVFDPKISNDAHKAAESFRREDVLGVSGKVRARGKGLENPKLDTGQIEIEVYGQELISKAATPPLEIDDRIVANDDVRLKYRYLDLRRPIMQKNLFKRFKIIAAARDYFAKNEFIELETPMLVRSTPEGARDYVVPSRVNPGQFFALPQSPQLYKQISMIAGFDRYFQVARCLRDEDLRQDRQPEHTQLDFEMSFVESDDILEFVEGLYAHIFKEVLGVKVETPFKRLTYQESMDKYGTDKPDLRYDLELVDVSDVVKGCDFQVFNTVIENGGIVKVVNPQKEFGRKGIDSLIDFSQKAGAKGMAWMRVTENGLESNIAKFFNDDIKKKLIDKVGAKPGSILMFIADKPAMVNNVLSLLRQELARKLELVKDEFVFCWTTDFPLFAWDEDTESWTPEHHMFSMPKQDHVKYLDSDPGKVLGDLFDLVLNGVELGSGSIRIHDPKIQKKVMKVIGLNEKEANQKFGFLLEAYKYGAPVHGGMGLGLDRTVALMCGLTDIREVIAFPKNKGAQCPMDGSPGTISDTQMKELHLKSSVVKK